MFLILVMVIHNPQKPVALELAEARKKRKLERLFPVAGPNEGRLRLDGMRGDVYQEKKRNLINTWKISGR